MQELGVGTSFYGIVFIFAALLATALIAYICNVAYLLIKQTKETTEISIDRNVNLTINIETSSKTATVKSANAMLRIFECFTPMNVRSVGSDQKQIPFLPLNAHSSPDIQPEKPASELTIEEGEIEDLKKLTTTALVTCPQRTDSQQFPKQHRGRIIGKVSRSFDTSFVVYSKALDAYHKQIKPIRKIGQIINSRA